MKTRGRQVMGSLLLDVMCRLCHEMMLVLGQDKTDATNERELLLGLGMVIKQQRRVLQRDYGTVLERVLVRGECNAALLDEGGWCEDDESCG